MNTKKTGLQMIAEERSEQINKHGRTLEKDIINNSAEQLSKAASILCTDYPVGCLEIEDVENDHCPEGWDKEIWKKMVNKPYHERLIIAGALIAAELDRLHAALHDN